MIGGGAMMEPMADRPAGGGVTRKEAEVLAGLGEQLSNAEIAARMYVSERTVETHVSSLLRKLGASNRRELGRLAGRPGVPAAAVERPVGPSGTVTFLFTDIEDSTALWERFPSAMADVLAHHDALLREAIARHGGYVFGTAGDGFGAAFASAPEAVAAAVDAQRSLASTAWPHDVAVRVRMGLHTGTATQRGGDYVGSAVNRAARVAAIGRGGHVLMSAASADLVADEGWTMVDLGRYHLQGLDRPERIVRLDAPGLPVVARALRARREAAGNLPHPTTRLIGRHDEVGRLVDLLGAHRLVTVTGPGGAGKTRLALAAARVVADERAGGTWFVELGELQDAADVPAAVATTLSLQPAAGADHAASTVAALTDQQALLVLDNCEHVLDGVVPLLTALESRCAGLTVLATSREALGLAHEIRFDLYPLGLERAGRSSDAIELFRERATAVRGTFQPSNEDLEVIDEICCRLDGLPLAIELAAARLSAMSLAELRSNLNDGFGLLTPRRGVTARQQSLRATVAWSYDLLTDVEQSLFDQLSVFGADFGPSAARAVGSQLAVPADDLLRSLVDKSLLTTTRGPLGYAVPSTRDVAPVRGGPPRRPRRATGDDAAPTRPLRGVDGVRRRRHQRVGRAPLASGVQRRMAERAQRVPLGLPGRRRRRGVPAGQRDAVVVDVTAATRDRAVVQHGARPSVGGGSSPAAGPGGRSGTVRPHARRRRHRAAGARARRRGGSTTRTERRTVAAGRGPQPVGGRTGGRPRRCGRPPPPRRDRRQPVLAVERRTGGGADPGRAGARRATVARGPLDRPHQGHRRRCRRVRSAERHGQRARLVGDGPAPVPAC
jgi:predicted ATPase/class 3 adenylate cyclase